MLHVELIEAVPSPITQLDFQTELSELFVELGHSDAAIEILMTGDKQMQQLNQQHRGVDKTTDVLSLPTAFDTTAGKVIPDPSLLRLKATEGQAAPSSVGVYPAKLEERSWAQNDSGFMHLGTIVISLPQAKRQVGRFGDDLESEIIGLAKHGLRHVLGFDHDDEGNWLT